MAAREKLSVSITWQKISIYRKLYETAVFVRIPQKLKDTLETLAKSGGCYEADVHREALKEGLQNIARRSARAAKVGK